MTNKNIKQFYISWRSSLDNLLSGYVYNGNEALRPTRFAYLTLQYYLTRLLDGRLEDINKVVLLPGIRGVGKTTLLSQLYFFEKYLNPKQNKSLSDNASKLINRIYISADKLFSEGFSLNDFFKFYEESIAGNFSDASKKTLILIDEIQYDKNWGLFLKLLYDKTKRHKNVLIIATGSSALMLNRQNADLIRRSTVEEIFPLKFVEYLLLRSNIFPQKGLSQEIKSALFFSDTAKEAYTKLQNLEKKVFAAWSEVQESEITKKRYFEVGAFPFALDIASASLAMDRIRDMLLVNIAQKDLISLGDFDAETLVKIPDLLYLLASSDEITTGKISNALKINERTLSKALNALLRAEIIFEVLPYGRPYSQIKKSSKYLFIAPSIRISLLSAIIPAGLMGKPLEDYLALIFAKELSKDAQFFYDYSSGGADFIVRFKDKREIVLEVGFGKEEIRQVVDTLNKTEGRGKYGMIIGSDKLELINKNVLKIPLEYLLLM